MATPWSLQFDEDGNPVGLYDAATAADVNRSPASSAPLILTRKGRAGYSPYSNSVARAPSQVAPQAYSAPQNSMPGLPGMQSMGSDVNIHQALPMGNRLDEKAQITDSQKNDIQHMLFQSPEQSRLLMEQATGNYPLPLRDDQGAIVHQKNVIGYDKDNKPITADGDVVYDPNHTQADPEHPYQQGMSAIQAARELMKQRLQFAPNQTDLSPLMSLADSWAGPHSHMAESYKPHTYDQAAQAALQYTDELNKRQVDMAKDAMTAANAQKAGLVNNALTAQLLQSREAGAGMGRPFYGVPPEVKTYDLWSHSDPVKAYNSTKSALDNLAQMRHEVEIGNPIDDARFPVMRASLDAHGRPNIAEVSIEGGDPSVVSRYGQSISKYLNGRMSAHNRQLALQSIDEVGKMLQSQMSRTASLGKQIAPNYGVDPGRVNRTFGYQMPPGLPSASQESSGPSIKDMMLEIVNQKKAGQ